MTYYTNKQAAIFNNTEPTQTDQAAADQSNINIIVGQQLTTGYAPGAPKQPLYEDFTQFPTDLRSALEQSREVQKLRRRLPPNIAAKPVPELLALTPEQLADILKPAATEQPTGEPPK